MAAKKARKAMPKKTTKRSKTKKSSSKVRGSNFLPSKRSNKLALLVVVLAVAALGTKLLFFSHAATPFIDLGAHPQATLQPTALGKTIYTLKAWNGKIYAGYGDYNVNTGPIAITPYDPVTKSFASTPELVDQTEAIGLYRILNGKLYASSTDPHPGVNSDFAVGTASGSTASWQQFSTVGAAHDLDMASLTGSDLWIVGAGGGYNADAWRSTDGGATWTNMLDLPPTSGNFARFYAAGVYNGKLYLEAEEINATSYYVAASEGKSHVFDPVTNTWSTGPNLAGATWWHPEQFANKLVYTGWPNPDYPSPNYLSAFDGSKVINVYTPSAIWDYTIDGNTLYILGTNELVYSTTDLVNWTTVQQAPATGSSIAVYNGVIYVGGTDAHLYSYDLANGILGGTSSGGGTTSTGGKTHGGGGGGGGCKGKHCNVAQ